MANHRVRYSIMLRPEDIKPWIDGFEVVGVFNPGACRVNGKYVLLIRVAEAPKDRKDFLRYSPRLEFEGKKYKVVVDTYRFGVDCTQDEPRSLYSFGEKRGRLTTLSHIRLATSPDGKTIDNITDGPVMPFSEREEYGQEDARIVPLNGDYTITSVAPSSRGIFTFFRKTRDFKEFGEPWIFPVPECKDTFPFPEKINGRYCTLTRPPGNSKRKPSIHIAFSKDLHSWGKQKVLMECRERGFDSLGIGGGAPPLKTKKGWLEIYHGVEKRDKSNDVPLDGVYSCGAALMDLDDPANITARSRDALFEPQTRGYTFYPDAVFISGAHLEDDLVNVFGGLDDEFVFSAMVPLNKILKSLGYCEKKKSRQPVLATV